jgi:tetratricopeptide (TPR) repeat protein
MHSLVRRFLGTQNASRDIHEACLAYYSGEGGLKVSADAVYHRYFLDPAAAADAWIDAFRQAVRVSAHEECLALLAVRRELPATFGARFGDEAGEYLARLSRYADAENEFLENEIYQKNALISDPNNVGADNYQGIALQRWADLRSRQSDHAGAEEKYEAAVAACDRALALAPNDIAAHNNKGNALQNWAALRWRQSDYAGAEEKYEAAVAAYDRALALAPNLIEAHNNKGSALQSWATVKLQANQTAETIDLLRRSSRAATLALTISPNPRSYELLIGSNLDLSKIVPLEEAHLLVQEAVGLCHRWAVEFTWDEARAAEAKRQVIAAANDRGLQL